MQTLTRKQLTDLLTKNTRSSKIGMRYRTLVKLNAGSVYRNRLHRIVDVTGHVNFSYANMKERAGDETPVKPRSWGKRIGTSCVIQHNDDLYVEFKHEHKGGEFFTLDGDTVTEAEVAALKEHIKEFGTSSGQRPEMPVRTIKVSNILRLSAFGDVYTILP